MRIKISKNVLIISLLLLAAMQIDSLPYILPTFIASLLNRWLSLAVCAVLFILILHRGSMSHIFMIICSFFVYFGMISILKNPSDAASYIKEVVPLLSLCMVAEYYMPKDKMAFLRATLLVLTVLILIDLFTILAFPDGLYRYDTTSHQCWFLGYKTARVRLATMPVIMIAGILSIIEKNKLSIKFWIITVLAVVDTFLTESTGGLVSIAIMIILIAALYIYKNERIRERLHKLFNFRLLLIVTLGLTLMVNVLQSFEIFSPIITTLFGKDMTLTGRLRIWNTSLSLISDAPIFGNGYISNTHFASIVNLAAATQPHSLFLGVLVYTGAAGFIIYLIMLNSTFSMTDQAERNSPAIICGIFIFAVLIHGIVSMHLFSQFLYVSMIMVCYLSDSYTKKKMKSKIFYFRSF